MAEIRVKETGTIKLFESDNTSSVTIASPASLGADRTITLPDADVTLVSGTMSTTPGITEYDTWRLSSGFAGDADPIASNWERNNSSGTACPLGTGMSESSGIFTFPSTGKWLITFKITWDHGGETSTYNQGLVKVTLNNSAYTSVDNATDTGDASNGRAMALGQYFFDVTDVANCKAAFAVSVQNDNVNTMGDSAYNLTAAFFARIGDT